MPGPIGEAVIRLRPDHRGFKDEADRGISGAFRGLGGRFDRAGKDSGRRFGAVFARTSAGPIKGVIGMVGGPLAGAFAAIAGTRVLGGFIGEARESAKIGRITAQVIKTTGGAARISAKQVGTLAEAISGKTGVDDEAIQSGANLLLTFTNIRNEVGKGNDIFNQATQRITDMGAALGQDAKASAIQLGKALNDPIKGVTALSRVGVSFTEQQKKQIATMVKSGDTLGAQKIILAELGREFGGAAEAAADPMSKLGTIVGNLGERVGTALLPAVNSFANFAVRTLVPAIERGAVVFEDRILPVIVEFGARTTPIIQQVAAVLVEKIGQAIPIVSGLVGWFVQMQGWLVPLGAGILAVVGALKLYHGIQLAVATATRAWAVAQGILNAVMSANPLGLIILAVTGIAAALVVAYTKSETFRDVVNGALTGVMQTTGNVVGFMVQGFRALLNVWLTVAGGILAGAAKALGWVPTVGKKLEGAEQAFDAFKNDVLASLDTIAQQAYGIGQDVGTGLASGIRFTAAEAEREAYRMGHRAALAVARGAQAKSPSRLTLWAGRMIGEGYVQGMQARMSDVTLAGRALGLAALAGHRAAGTAAPVAGAQAAGTGGGLTVNIGDIHNPRQETLRETLQTTLRRAAWISGMGVA